LDSGGLGTDLEIASVIQREMNTIMVFIISTDKALLYIVRSEEEPQKLYTVSLA
jgi:hypothetical protein